MDRPMWVYNSENERVENREISYVPGLYKIFDEILVNAADNKQNDAKMSEIRVTIDREAGEISVWNNGRGIPVEIHSVWQPFLFSVPCWSRLTRCRLKKSTFRR